MPKKLQSKQQNNEILQTVLANLRKNNMSAQYVESKSDVAGIVSKLLDTGDTISVGGSVTLEETKVLELVKEQKYHFIDRYEERLSEEEQKQRLLAAFTSDVFLCSANAIIHDGEIYQVDGLSNRIAPLVFGPDRVIIIAGTNKIVKNIEEAVFRGRTMTAGCQCDDRRCCNFLIMGRQRMKNRIHVIIVGERLGF